jgi:DNA (cytosine-5)-methyltransferase 1
MDKKHFQGQFKFADLFAGIGGTRIGFELAGCKCVFASEWDRFAQQTYVANFNEMPEGDITKVESRSIPDHDILIAGFPCQPFSISGVVKKNSLNRPHGFDDPTQGTMYFEIYRILKDKRPSAFMLENVRYLKRHDQGRTFKLIIQSLTEDLGYTVYHALIDSSKVVPQHRERIYIVGFNRPTWFLFPELDDRMPKLRDILEDNVPEKYVLSDHLWDYLQRYAAKHRACGNGFGYGLANLDGITRTLSARYYKDGSEILVPRDNGNPRRLTPRECARLMGFPDSFKITVSDTQAYRQFGNSVVVPVIEAIAKRIVTILASTGNTDGCGNT